MVQAAVSKHETLFKRIRSKFDTDEQCKRCVDHIIFGRLQTWDVPSLYNVQLMTKENLIDVLFYTPESNFYYSTEEAKRKMVEQDTRQDVLKMVKAMIFKHSMNGVTSIAEIGS